MSFADVEWSLRRICVRAYTAARERAIAHGAQPAEWDAKPAQERLSDTIDELEETAELLYR